MGNPTAFIQRKGLWAVLVLAVAAATFAVTALLFNVFERKREGLKYPFKVVEITSDEIDPAVWGKNFPFEYDTFIRTSQNYGRTAYGGSEPYSKLEKVPAMKRLWAGYPF